MPTEAERRALKASLARYEKIFDRAMDEDNMRIANAANERIAAILAALAKRD